MKNKQIMLDEATERLLIEGAKAEGVSVSAMVRLAVKSHFGAAEFKDAYQSLQALVGITSFDTSPFKGLLEKTDL